MRKIREVLRLLWDQQRSIREVAVICGVARSTVADYERRAKAAGLCWPLSEHDDAVLEVLLFPSERRRLSVDAFVVPDWDLVDRELRKKKSVTRFLLWQEHRSVHQAGYSYTRFCELFADWRKLQGLSMRMTHIAGEKLFVDYAGQTIGVVNPDTGEIHDACLFLGAWGASHYSYAEATWSSGLEDWIGSHVRMLEYFGGCPEILVPDNLKAGVSKAHLYEPDINPTYLDFATHYDVAVIPARKGHPKDKAVVETEVLAVERFILARLRNHTFFSLSSLNDAIRELLIEFNGKPFQKRPGSRRSMFDELDKPALRCLPAERYVFASWKLVRPHLEYHVAIEGHYYSVPHQLVGKQLDARITAGTIEIFFKSKRVASHVRSPRQGGSSTIREHMPPAHLAHADMGEEKILAWAQNVGPNTLEFTIQMIASRMHPQQAYRSCHGVLALGKKHGNDRLEAATSRAVKLGSFTLKSVDAILRHNLDSQPLETAEPATLPKVTHVNVRGGSYYAAPSLTNEEPERTKEAC
jgi:transposase